LPWADGVCDQGADGRRQISRQIEKNRGLTPHRSKLSRNPRKHMREKYGKALIKRRSQVPKLKLFLCFSLVGFS
jgi:U3 small nucleolar RNA-associated protein 3